MKRILPFILWLAVISPVVIAAQTRQIEQLKESIRLAGSEKQRLVFLIELGKLKNSLHGDTVQYYAQWAKRLAIQLKDNHALAWAEYSIISGEMTSGKTDQIIPAINNNPLFKKIKTTDPDLYYKIQLLKANVLNRQNQRAAALELELQLLAEAEKENNTLARLFLLNYSGATYLNAGQPEDAKKNWLTGLNIIAQNDSAQYKEIEAYIRSNLAVYYLTTFYSKPNKAFNDTCFFYLNSCIDLSRKIEAVSVLASALTYRANLYAFQKELPAAEADFTEALAIRKKIGDPLYILEDYKNLAGFYYQKKNYAQALLITDEGLSMCKQFHIRETELVLYQIRAAIYKIEGDNANYATTLEKIIILADSSNKINAADKIAEIQTKYEVQKKETLIAQQKLSLFQRQLMLYGAAIGIFLLISFLAFRFKKYQQQEKQKLTLMLEEKKKQQENAIKDAEENERKRIAAELHDNLGVQANAILHNSNLLNTENSQQQIVVTDLQETAKEMLLNLRETLWAMKASDVTAKDLWLRLISFSKQMGRHYADIQFKINGEPPFQMDIPSAKALHIVLIVQEAVHNAVKHAGSNIILINCKSDLDKWVISIVDHGKGFQLNASTSNDHYGLSNMQERANLANLGFSVDSQINKGTTVQIII